MVYQAIIDAFVASAQTKKRSSTSTEDLLIAYHHKNNDPGQELVAMTASIYDKLFIARYTYTLSGFVSQIFSILDCSIILDKSAEYPVCYTFYDILNEIDPENFRCCTIPSITTPDMMHAAFGYLSDQVDRYTDRINQLALDEERRLQLGKNHWRDVRHLLGPAVTAQLNNEALHDGNIKQMLLRNHQEITRARFCMKPYLLLHERKYSLFIKRFAKVKLKTDYESRLLSFVESGPSQDFTFLPDQLSSVITAAEKHKTDIREAVSVFVPALFMAPFVFFVYAALFKLLFALATLNTVYVAASEIVFFMTLPAFITSIPLSYYTRHIAFRIFFGRSAGTHITIDHLTTTAGTNRFMKGFLNLIIVLSLVFTLLAANWHIAFTESGLIDRSSFFSIRGTYYPYTAVDAIYHTDGRINGYGEQIPYPSYIVVLANGLRIDLYQFLNKVDFEEKARPYLAGKGLSFRETDLPQSIP